MSQHDDQTFIRHFSWIMVALVAFTFAIAFLAAGIHSKLKPGDNPSREAAILERLKPVASVYAGEEGAAALAAVEAAAQAGAPAPFDGSTDGALIYNNVCSACHNTGVLDAPVPGAASMAERAERGLEALVASAIAGIEGTTMLAKGGRADLLDEQVQAAVEYMLVQ